MRDYIIYTAAGLIGFLGVYLPGHFRRRRERKAQLARFDAMVERYTREAEQGYDPETLVSRLREHTHMILRDGTCSICGKRMMGPDREA